MAEKARCEIGDRNFKDEEGLEMHNKAKHPKPEKKVSKINYKRIRKWAIRLIIFGLIIWGISAMLSGVKVLPPTTMQGHVEASPPSHVLKEPMPIAIQKHMLEHADGTGGPGVVINYNCEDYECESGLIESLESFADIYDYVYVAPFKKMDAKIALTKLNRIEILEEYDKNRIHIFISGGIPIDNEFSTLASTNNEPDQIEEVLIQTINIKEFSITAKQWQFSPDTIEVNEGDTVILNIKSIDVSHGIAIPNFGIDEFLSPGNEVRIEFIANKKGTFSFFCSVSCGVGHSGMRGKIIVN